MATHPGLTFSLNSMLRDKRAAGCLWCLFQDLQSQHCRWNNTVVVTGGHHGHITSAVVSCFLHLLVGVGGALLSVCVVCMGAWRLYATLFVTVTGQRVMHAHNCITPCGVGACCGACPD